MIATAHTAGILGIDGYALTVEAEVDHGLPCLTICDSKVASGHLRTPGSTMPGRDEARERVRAALGHCGHKLHARRQVVTLSPENPLKDSPGCDLAIACALLAAHDVVPAAELARTMLWAELALDGRLRPAAGTLITADAARKNGYERLIVAEDSASDLRGLDGLQVIVARDLAEVVALLRGEIEARTSSGSRVAAGSADWCLDMSELVGLELPRLAVEVMLAGGHHLLLEGPPAVGKTMLARRVAGIMPDLSPSESLEVTKIHGVAHRKMFGMITRPPLRMPHHTVSVAGLLGGGNPPRPGEVSLAHRGVLFLDELPEFSRACIKGLGMPLDNGEVSIVRARYALRYPARFQLLAAMNSCPCGFLGHDSRGCADSPAAVQRYQGRIENLRPHFDMRVSMQSEQSGSRGDPSAVVRERITAARDLMERRLDSTQWVINADIPSNQDNLLHLSQAAERFIDAQELSAETKHRVRRVARTIQDLNDGEIDASPFALVTTASVFAALELVQVTP